MGRERLLSVLSEPELHTVASSSKHQGLEQSEKVGPKYCDELSAAQFPQLGLID